MSDEPRGRPWRYNEAPVDTLSAERLALEALGGWHPTGKPYLRNGALWQLLKRQEPRAARRGR
jgi:hypothetical protein